MKRLLNIYHRKVTEKALEIFVSGFGLAMLLTLFVLNFRSASVQVTSGGSTTLENIIEPSSTRKPSPTPSPVPLPSTYVIPQQFHTFQTFNNCGPASLSMLLSYQGLHVGQKELGDILRPRQHPQGIEDDKSVTIPELAFEAERRGLVAYHRPGGSIQLVKVLIANDIPVLVRTWLSDAEDIGHYRIIRGFDDVTQVLIQDDSLQGNRLRYSYTDFEALWLPFQFEFLVVGTPESLNKLKQLLGSLIDNDHAWQNFNTQSIPLTAHEPENPYHLFNQSIAAFHLGDYSRSIQAYEQVATRMPARMLWYQIQPIEAYLRLGEYDKVIALTSEILKGPNKAFSELYLLRGQAYERLGQLEAASQEYKNALLYNANLEAAKQAYKGTHP